MNASLVSLTWLSITGPLLSLQGFLTFLQISHVPASRSRSQLRSELEGKHTSLRSASYPRLSATVQARGLGVMLEIKQASQEQHLPLLLPLPPGKVRRAPPALLSSPQIALPSPRRPGLSSLGAVCAPYFPPCHHPPGSSSPQATFPLPAAPQPRHTSSSTSVFTFRAPTHLP